MGEAIAFRGTRLPRLVAAPQPAAPRHERWRADAGVKIAALLPAALHHALAGERQRRFGRACAPRFGPVGFRVVALVPTSGREARVPAGRGAMPTPRAAARAVERDAPSDMLRKPKCPGISRGFEVSVSRDRCCPAARGALAIPIARTAAGGSTVHAWMRGTSGLERKALHGREAHALAATPGSGARGGLPTETGARGRADRHAMARSAHGFRSPGRRPFAARALQRSAGMADRSASRGDGGSRVTLLDEERVR